MRDKGLHQEVSEHALHGLDLLRLARTLLDPLPTFCPGFIDRKKPALAPTLDQLIGLRNPFRVGGEQPWVLRLGLVKDGLDGLVFCKVECRELRGRIVCRGWRQWRCFDDVGACEEVADNGLAVGFVN